MDKSSNISKASPGDRLEDAFIPCRFRGHGRRRRDASNVRHEVTPSARNAIKLSARPLLELFARQLAMMPRR